MREALDHDLNTIVAGATEMLDRVRAMLVEAGSVLIDRDTDKLSAVAAADREVDELESRIETECLRVIALHQPVASDLRLIATILKSLTDIERMGDYAVHVAEDGALLSQDSPLKKYVNLSSMLRRLDQMMETLGRAVRERSVDLARQAHEMDNEVDELYEQTQRELVTYMIEDPRTISKAMTLMRVGRSLERLGDHIENIAERVEYWVTGRRA
ncbi:phosphate transport system protein [Deinobacterium chartae]|uniref:Phosphate-specific transport system accessory protein PhoU n=1 Tax=Deinobacterium chartae TaxID=521158 RepID=A0A841I1J2_9DEIO|nr:phosphate signaling complex protein PhoU [Deinobacterium chartae]MBB6098168.1 phosphate transport system protein [Deinobacterium chartae]